MDGQKRRLEILKSRFIKMREERELTMEELSETAGISLEQLKKMETGSDFELDDFFQLCEKYGVDPAAALEKL